MARHAISVVMATHNGQSFLVDQLNSISAQSRLPDELVISDDASVDATVEIVREFAGKAPFPVHIRLLQENIGYTKNFWQATALARGDIIFFCDQDDVWMENKIETVVQEFENRGPLMISHDLEIIDENNNVLLESYYDAVGSMNISPAIVIHGCVSAFQRKLLDFTGFPACPVHWSHDTWLCGIAAALDSRVIINRPLIKYRVHGRNATGWYLRPKRGLKSLLYKISVPPFTTSSEFDYIIEFYATQDNIAEFEEQIQEISTVLERYKLDETWKSVERRSAIIAFAADSRYDDPIFRFRRCAGLFCDLAYRTGGRLPGLALDILGRRGRRPLATDE